MKMLGLALIIIGAIGILWGGFSYVKDRDSVDLGVATIVTEEKGHVNIPPTLGVIALAVGGVLLGLSSRKRA